MLVLGNARTVSLSSVIHLVAFRNTVLRVNSSFPFLFQALLPEIPLVCLGQQQQSIPRSRGIE
uniref:Uncharacterized protein n=1 Tax=Utricularia reniformis TaxID=192314 RepID=A0A1Y0B2G5_9LAMI|nr:hypothetical protein AEK19_MT1351 [Utricularia reniformis]ART31549.1 hypothetical protein AEK19_MT1351 [Utricularia reniformis]